MKQSKVKPDAERIREAARKAAANIWFDLNEPRSREGEPLTFALVGSAGSGISEELMYRLMQDATQRLMRGVSARDVKDLLRRVQPDDNGVRLAGTVDELEALFFRGFGLGDNSVEVAGGESGRGKHIDWCVTYTSADHRLF